MKKNTVLYGRKMDGAQKEEKVMCLSITGETEEKNMILGKNTNGFSDIFQMKCNVLSGSHK